MIKVSFKCSESISEQIKKYLKTISYIEYVDENQLDSQSVIIILINTIDALHQAIDLKDKYQSDIICIVEDETYMFDLLDINPVLFMKNPCTEDDLSQMFDFFEMKNNNLDYYIEFKTSYSHIRLCAKTIMYIESYGHNLVVHSEQASFVVREKLSDTLFKLQPYGFIQTHKSFIVNKSFIHKKTSHEIILCDSTQIPIGKTFKKLLKI